MSVSAKERRKQYRDEVRKAQEDSQARKDDSGKFKSIFKDVTGGMFKCTEGEHTINIIPFIAGPNHPTKKEGKSTYILDLFVHGKVGINENSYVCMTKTFGEDHPCPVCEHQAELRKQDNFDEEEVKSLNPGRRAIYNIEVRDKESDYGKILLWDVSHFLFEKTLVERADSKKGGKIFFADPDDGRSIYFKRTGKGAKDTKYTILEFEKREPIPDELLDAAFVIDEKIHYPEYDEVYSALHGTPRSSSERPPADEERGRKAKEEETPDRTAKGKEQERKDEPADDVQEPEGCPFEHIFGVDVDTFDECGECEKNAECLDEFEKIQEDKERRRQEREKARKEAEAAKNPPQRTRTSRSVR